MKQVCDTDIYRYKMPFWMMVHTQNVNHNGIQNGNILYGTIFKKKNENKR